METVEKKCILDHFADLEDPRTRESQHRLDEILLVAICGILSGGGFRVLSVVPIHAVR